MLTIRMIAVVLLTLAATYAVQTYGPSYFEVTPVEEPRKAASSPCVIPTHPQEGGLFIPCGSLSIEHYPLTWLSQGREV